MTGQLAMDMAPPATAQLVWGAERDQYHTKTDCGRYSVCWLKVGVLSEIHVIAWRCDPNKRAFAVQLECLVLPLEASTAERQAAIATMKQRCADDAAGRIAA